MGINKKPVIVFDQEIFNLQKHGGISRYFSKLINGLQHSDDFTVLPDKYLSHVIIMKLSIKGILWCKRELYLSTDGK